MAEQAKLLEIQKSRETANWVRVWPRACNSSLRARRKPRAQMLDGVEPKRLREPAEPWLGSIPNGDSSQSVSSIPFGGKDWLKTIEESRRLGVR